MANDTGVAVSSSQLFHQFHAVVNAQSILTDIAHVNIFDHTAIAGIKLVALRVPGADSVNIVSSIVTMTPNTANPSPSAASQSRNVVKFIEKIVGIRNGEF